MRGRELLSDADSRLDAMLETLRVLVEYESSSHDKTALDVLADALVERLRRAGGRVDRIDNPDGGDHLVARFDLGAPQGEKPALILGHYDTVWPLGTTAARPFRIEEGRAFGPGAYDMKAGLVLAMTAVEMIAARPGPAPRPVVVLITSDEEIGSPTSRGLIEEWAMNSAYVLVVEPPLADGSLKTARKGVGGYIIEVAGRSAHAGVEPEKGVNAILELAHHVLALHALNRPEVGSTVSVGVISGGTTPNVVPARAAARVDVRAATKGEADRLDEAISALRPVLPGAEVTVSGGFNRPPMERTVGIAALFGRAREVAKTLGLNLSEGATGGGSDGNFTAALGVPTLDGLGAAGAHAHAEDENVLIASLPERAALLAALLLSL